MARTKVIKAKRKKLMIRPSKPAVKRMRLPKEVAVTLMLFDFPSLEPARRRRDATRMVQLEMEKGKALGLLLIGYTNVVHGVRRPVFGVKKYRAMYDLKTSARLVWEFDRLPNEQIVPEAVGI